MRLLAGGQAVMIAMRIMVAMIIMPKTLFAMKYIEIKTERIQSGYKDTHHDRKVSKAWARNTACSDRFNNGVFRIKTGEEWSANECQGS